MAEQFLPDQIDEYWRRVPVWGLESNSNADYIIRKLLQYQRPLDALELIDASHYKKHFLTGDIIFETLEALVTTQPNDIIQHNHIAYVVVSLIEWLEENWDDKKVLHLEWWYFKLFESYGSKGPKKLYMALANDPNFFLEMLCRTFKGRHETKSLSRN